MGRFIYTIYTIYTVFGEFVEKSTIDYSFFPTFDVVYKQGARLYKQGPCL